MHSTLDYLDFDYSEDADGNGSFDAMAAVAPQRLAALQAELLRVLDWASQEFGGVRGPLDDGGDWDCELQGMQEVATPLQVRYEGAAGGLQLEPATAGVPRITLSLTLGGTPAFCAALRERFGLP